MLDPIMKVASRSRRVAKVASMNGFSSRVRSTR